ncbi:MAG TPA: hypothetical protein VGL53_31700 [Bryobacteraceae bacterium]
MKSIVGSPICEDRQMLPAEIQGLIEAHINAFNTNDNNAFYEVFSDNAIIVDGIAPFCWPNPNCPEKWMADVAKWREGLGVVKEHLSYETGFSIVEGPAVRRRLRNSYCDP